MHFSRGNSTYQEIKSQRETWQATLSLIEETPTFAIEQLHNPEVIFRGCGSTYYLSLAAASVWRRSPEATIRVRLPLRIPGDRPDARGQAYASHIRNVCGPRELRHPSHTLRHLRGGGPRV